MKIGCLTEGGIGIGDGHISRTTALADAFSALDHEITFIIRGEDPSYSLDRPFQINFMEWFNLNYLGSISSKYDILVVDSYEADKKYLNYLTSSHKSVVFIIDSTLNFNNDGTIIFPSIYASKDRYDQYFESCKKSVFRGRDYLLYTKEFWPIKKIRVKPLIIKIGISLGSSGVENIISRISIFEKVLGYKPSIRLFGKYKPKMSKIIESRHFEFVGWIDKISYINKLKKIDLLICNGGQTLNEAILLGLPCISLVTADNQKENSKEWESMDLCFTIDIREDFNERKLKSVLQLIKENDYRKKMNKKSQQLIDSNGAKRAVSKIISN